MELNDKIARVIIAEMVRNEQEIWITNRGYPVVRIFNKIHSIHRVIYLIFTGHIKRGYCIHHKDRDKMNYNPENLEMMKEDIHKEYHRLCGN